VIWSILIYNYFNKVEIRHSHSSVTEDSILQGRYAVSITKHLPTFRKTAIQDEAVQSFCFGGGRGRGGLEPQERGGL